MMSAKISFFVGKVSIIIDNYKLYVGKVMIMLING